jgi:hypothetical protein
MLILYFDFYFPAKMSMNINFNLKIQNKDKSTMTCGRTAGVADFLFKLESKYIHCWYVILWINWAPG